MDVVRSKEVCHHWRRGHCEKGERCLFSHVGHQNNPAAPKKAKVPVCSNGSDCDWLRKGICSYFHPRIGVQKPWLNKKESQEPRIQGGRQEATGQRGRQEARGQGGRQEARSQGGRQDTRGQGGRQESRSQGSRQEARSQVNIPRRNLIQPDRLDCKFDGRCERIPNCPWIHSMEDFPPLVGGRRNKQRREH